ncbi:MAG: TIGR04086 family membrane protein [Acetatifactor sp.]|nr:TIGR04086 family membrane protein [Acetatifactor sp.]
MRRPNAREKKIAVELAKYALFSYLLTGAALLVVSFLFYRMNWGEKGLTIAVTVIYALVTFVAGLLCGKSMESKKYLWGLCMGVLYYVVLVVLSLIFGEQNAGNMGRFLVVFLLCAGSGMLGGMCG